MTPTAAPAEPVVEEPLGATPDPMPNNELARVLIGILRAKGLADGISLSVSDDAVGVIGDVASAEQRSGILKVLEAGRGSRSLDASLLTVGSPPDQR